MKEITETLDTKKHLESSLVVGAFTAAAQVQSLAWELRSHMRLLHATTPQNKIKSLCCKRPCQEHTKTSHRVGEKICERHLWGKKKNRIQNI